MRTLVLSDGWVPMVVVPWQRAVSLVYDGKATIVEESEQVIRSPSTEMRVPSIIAFKKGSRPKKKAIKFSRENIMIRDNWQCQYCSAKLQHDTLTYDHVLPRSQGGKTSWDNVVACCYSCNQRKSNRTPQEAKMHLLNTPVRPKYLPNLFRMRWTESMPESWKPYLEVE